MRGERLRDARVVDRDASGLKLSTQLVLPAAATVQADVDETVYVGRLLDVVAEQNSDPLPAQLAEEEAQLEDHVLTAPASCGASGQTSFVIPGEKNDGIGRGDGVILELLQDRPPSVGLLVQDDHLPTRGLLQNPDGEMKDGVVSSVDDEDRS